MSPSTNALAPSDCTVGSLAATLTSYAQVAHVPPLLYKMSMLSSDTTLSYHNVPSVSVPVIAVALAGTALDSHDSHDFLGTLFRS